MRIAAIVLGGCLKAPPVSYGITEDTGGHIAYVLGAMGALAAHGDVTSTEIFTRLFEGPEIDPVHSAETEVAGSGLVITRIDSGNRAYLAKERLAADRAAFTRTLIARLKERRDRPDLIHAHFADAADVARAIRDELGIPFVYTPHSLGLDKRQAMGSQCPALSDRIAEEDRAIAAADAVVASSRDECERQLPAYPSARFGRIHRLRPGIEVGAASEKQIDGARELLAPFLRRPDRPLILAIARPVAKKNLVRLVEAYATTPGLSDKANLAIVAGLRCGLLGNDGEQRSVLLEIADTIDRFDLHGKVAWPRRHEQDHVPGLYALAKRTGGIFVNPALTEPYGLTLLEAAAHHVPIVATCNGGPVDIVEEIGHGLLVDPGSAETIGEGMARLIEDRGLWNRCSMNAFERAPQITWQRYANGFVSLAREILDGLRTPAIPAPEMPQASMLVLSDIDNTLTGCDVGARRFAAAITRRPEAIFGVATGRALLDARRVLREWSLPAPRVMVTSVGTEIYWQRGGEFVRDEAFAELIGADWDPEGVEAALKHVPGMALQTIFEQRTWKRSWSLDDPETAEQVRRLLAAAGIEARVVFSHERLLDVLPIRAGKGAAMAYVASALGIPGDRVIAIGDSGNDRDMLLACRNAVLVGNHEASLQDLAAQGHVRVSRRHHANGALEGIAAFERRCRMPAATSTIEKAMAA